jgi:hypothetical protein
MIESIFPYLFTFVFAAAVIEIILSARWSPRYFSTGIPIYKRTVAVTPGAGRVPAAEQVEAVLPPSGRSAPMVVRRIGENRLAFREKLFHFGIAYSPVMRGCITCDPATGGMEAHGYLNWYILLFISSFLFFLLILPVDPANIIIPLCMLVLLSYIYWMQKKRFAQVENAVLKLWRE